MHEDIIERWNGLLITLAGGTAAGRRALASELHVNESTVYRWTVNDTTPGVITRGVINARCDSLGVPHVYSEEKPDAAP